MAQSPIAPVTPPPDYSRTLYHNDMSALPLGPLTLPDPSLLETCALPAAVLPGGLRAPVVHPAWLESGAFKVIERGVNRFIETVGASPLCEDRMLVAGDSHWSDVRVRAVVTPLTFDGCGPGGGICGLIARYRDPRNFLALVLDRDFHVKLLQKRDGQWILLDARPLEFCLGQSLTLTLTLQGPRVHGTAGPYTGAAHLYAYMAGAAVPIGIEAWGDTPKGGKPLALPEQPASCAAFNGCVGFIADVPARCGTLTVEATAEEADALEARAAARTAHVARAKAKVPPVKLLTRVALQGLVSGPNVRVADVNGDGKPELILAQHSPKIAAQTSMSRLTCLTVMDLSGKILWQAGVPDPDAPLYGEDLPVEVFDLYHDGHGVIVCAFGYDIQIRDGKTGRVLNSAQTPDLTHWPISGEYRDTAYSRKFGDERENLNIARLASAKILGNGNPDDILVLDDYHHLVALDGINLKPLFKHRGNHGRSVQVLDLDGDGRDEVVAGGVILDGSGKTISAASFGGFPTASVAVKAQAGEDAGRSWVLAGRDGLALLPLNGAAIPPLAGWNVGFAGWPVERLACAKLRADLPGLQFATWGSGTLQLFDAGGRRLWTQSIDSNGVALKPVHWPGQDAELLLLSMAPGGGLINGAGEHVVEAPTSGPSLCCAVSPHFAKDVDALLAWDTNELHVWVPDSGVSKRKSDRRSSGSGAHGAQVSLPL